MITPELDNRLKNIESMLERLLKIDSFGDEVDVEEAARICHLSATTIYTLMSNGKMRIPREKRGRNVFFKRADVIAWNAERIKRVVFREVNKAA
jgi:excisionase family DNA binding protein